MSSLGVNNSSPSNGWIEREEVCPVVIEMIYPSRTAHAQGLDFESRLTYRLPPETSANTSSVYSHGATLDSLHRFKEPALTPQSLNSPPTRLPFQPPFPTLLLPANGGVPSN